MRRSTDQRGGKETHVISTRATSRLLRPCSRAGFGLCLALLCLVVAAPGNTRVAAQGATNGRVSFLHLSADAPSLDVYIDGGRAVAGLSFGEASAYLGLAPGPHQLAVTAAGRLDPLLRSTLAPQTGLSGTIVLSGLVTAGDIAPAAPPEQTFGAYVQLGDDASSPGTMGRLRVLDASPGAGPLDVRVDGPATAMLGSALSYAGTGIYTVLPPGSYTLSVFPSGSSTPVAQIPGVTIGAGNAYTLVLGGVLAGFATRPVVQPFQAVKLTDQIGGPSQTLTAGCNQVILPLAAGSPLVDVLLRVTDPDVVLSIWRFDNAVKTFRAGYFSDPSAPLDYATTAGSPEAAFICVSADTTWNPGS